MDKDMDMDTHKILRKWHNAVTCISFVSMSGIDTCRQQDTFSIRNIGATEELTRVRYLLK